MENVDSRMRLLTVLHAVCSIYSIFSSPLKPRLLPSHLTQTTIQAAHRHALFTANRAHVHIPTVKSDTVNGFLEAGLVEMLAWRRGGGEGAEYIRCLRYTLRQYALLRQFEVVSGTTRRLVKRFLPALLPHVYS